MHNQIKSVHFDIRLSHRNISLGWIKQPIELNSREQYCFFIEEKVYAIQARWNHPKPSSPPFKEQIIETRRSNGYATIHCQKCFHTCFSNPQRCKYEVFYTINNKNESNKLFKHTKCSGTGNINKIRCAAINPSKRTKNARKNCRY